MNRTISRSIVAHWQASLSLLTQSKLRGGSKWPTLLKIDPEQKCAKNVLPKARNPLNTRDISHIWISLPQRYWSARDQWKRVWPCFTRFMNKNPSNISDCIGLVGTISCFLFKIFFLEVHQTRNKCKIYPEQMNARLTLFSKILPNVKIENQVRLKEIR